MHVFLIMVLPVPTGKLKSSLRQANLTLRRGTRSVLRLVFSDTPLAIWIRTRSGLFVELWLELIFISMLGFRHLLFYICCYFRAWILADLENVTDYQYEVPFDQRSCLMANRVGWSMIFHQENDADGDDVTTGSNSDLDEEPASAKGLRANVSPYRDHVEMNTHTHTFRVDNMKLFPSYDSLNHITAHGCKFSLFSVSEDNICARPRLDT